MRFFIFIVLFLISQQLFAQAPTKEILLPNHLLKLQQMEDSLRSLADTMIFADDEGIRNEACYTFIKKMVKALKTPQSYLYNFDSLKTVSIIHSPDNKFRILTWGILRHTGGYRYYGAIQMHSTKLEMFPLFDYSPIVKHPEDTVLNKDSWYGCMYYNIVPKIVGTKTYYTLFGWKAYNPRVVKKVMDVLYFDAMRKPTFGAPIISVIRDKKQKLIKRFIIEYNKSATATLNYDEATQSVIFDHLATKNEMDGKPETGDKIKGYDLFPDGTLEAFEWKNNRWEYIEIVKNLPAQIAPTPVPFFDNQKSKGYIKTKTVKVEK